MGADPVRNATRRSRQAKTRAYERASGRGRARERKDQTLVQQEARLRASQTGAAGFSSR